MPIPSPSRPARNRPGRVRLVLGALVLVLAAGRASAQSLDFADFLFQERDYYRAITEYERVLFHAAPDDHRTRSYATLQVGRALFEGQEFLRAVGWLRPRARDLGDPAYRADARRLLCRSAFNTQDQDLLRDVADELGAPETPFYTALAWGMSRRWDRAADLLAAVPEASPYRAAAVYDLEVAARADAMPWKSPTTAGVLAVVPGLGYWYAGHRRTAVTSLLMNAGFILATVQAFRSDQDALGGVLSLFSISWYHGNIVGSVGAARRFNAEQNRRLLDRLRD